jgi:hypothetical protein
MEPEAIVGFQRLLHTGEVDDTIPGCFLLCFQEAEPKDSINRDWGAGCGGMTGEDSFQ